MPEGFFTCINLVDYRRHERLRAGRPSVFVSWLYRLYSIENWNIDTPDARPIDYRRSHGRCTPTHPSDRALHSTPGTTGGSRRLPTFAWQHPLPVWWREGVGEAA